MTETEEEWLTATEPGTMLEFLEGKVSDRRLRLFAVACCRRIWERLEEECSRHSVEVAERYADGLASPKQLKTAHQYSEQPRDPVKGWGGELACASYASSRNAWGAAEGAARAASVSFSCTYHHVLKHDSSWNPIDGSQKAKDLAWKERSETNCAHASLLRDIFGNPFRPVVAGPSWLTPTVTALADAIYAERAFDRLPVLADALEEAGCDHPDVLAHCRGDGPHVRGCWVVDLVLGKT